MADETGKSGNLWDALFGELGRAVADVREKVVMEPWFGRAADHGVSPSTQSVAEELGWVKSGAEPERSPPADHGQSIDR